MDERIENGMRVRPAGWRSLASAEVQRVGWKIGLNA